LTVFEKIKNEKCYRFFCATRYFFLWKRKLIWASETEGVGLWGSAAGLEEISTEFVKHFWIKYCTVIRFTN